MTEPIKTVEEYIAWLRTLQGGMIIYRGLASAHWGVESSAYRRIRKSQDVSLEVVSRGTFLRYINQQLDDASLLGFRERPGRTLCDLELLAELQHFGAATCLIDFTSSALTALYFSCREKPNTTGKVVAMATDDIDRFSAIGYKDLIKEIGTFLFENKLWKWEPSSLNDRIAAQQSILVFGEGSIEKSFYEEVTIAAAFKRVILETLEKSFGISEQKLFNDLPGFARINAHDQPYDKFSAEDFYSLGITFHQRREYQEAIVRYDRAIELNPQDAYAYNNRGVTKSDSGDHQGAIADFDEAINLNPRLAEAFYNRGVTKSDSGDHQEAIADFDEAINLNPKLAEAFYNRGVTKSDSGDQLGAIADFDEAIYLNPKLTEAFYNRGSTKGGLGDQLGAIADFDKAIELNPGYAKAYINRGIAKGQSVDLLGAIADFDKAIELNPRLAEAYLNRGTAKLTLGDPQGAIADFDKAIELNPRYAEAYLNRGIAKRAIGDDAGAQKDFAKASEISPGLHPPK